MVTFSRVSVFKIRESFFFKKSEVSPFFRVKGILCVSLFLEIG